MTRTSWEETAMAVAETLAKRSTCLRLNVGALVYDDNRHILSTGYNGAPRGHDHCIDSEVGCLIESGHCVRALHAEANVILQAARIGVSLDGGHLITTHRPCIRCASMISQVGIKSVIAKGTYDSDEADRVWRIFYKSGINFIYNRQPEKGD